MRIIGGQAGGRRLYAPRGQSTRPTADRVKEAIFNVLAPYIAGSSVLDAFAGSGALALEALSRGARQAVLLEKDAAACRMIAANIVASGLSGARLLRGNALQLIGQMKGQEKFDLVLLDPPYASDLAQPVVTALFKDCLLNPGAIIIWETDAAHQAQELPSCRLAKSSSYGDTVVYYYIYEQAD